MRTPFKKVFFNGNQLKKGKHYLLLAASMTALYTGQAWSITGQELATKFNDAYQHTPVASCGKDQIAALWCTGLLARSVSPANTVTSDAVFMRKDTQISASKLLSSPTLIFILPETPQPTATPSMTTWCALAEGPGSNSNGSAHRCWPSGNEEHAHDTDMSSCSILMAPEDVTLPKWQAWRSEQTGRSCSFSTMSAVEFDVALKASENLKQALGISMPTWKVEDLNKLAIKALVYPEGDIQALKLNQQIRDEWQSSAGPITILRFKPMSGFSYSKTDNEKGSPAVNKDALLKMLGGKLIKGLEITFLPASQAEIRQNPDPVETRHNFLTSALYYRSQTITAELNRNQEYLYEAFMKGTYGVLGNAYGTPDAVFYVRKGNDVHAALVKKNARALKDWYAAKGHNIPLVHAVTSLPDHNSEPEKFFFIDDDVSVNNPDARVVAELNKRLNNIVPDCGSVNGNDIPAYMCSGLIIRSTGAGSPSHALTLPPKSIQQGAAAFSYIRRDTNTINLWNGAQGVILKPTADLAQRVKCIFPMDANSWGTYDWRDVAHNQCSNSKTATSNTDFSSCWHALGSGEARSLVQKFRSVYGYNRDKQCSFSTLDARQFYAAIIASSTNKDNMGYSWNEMIIKPWSDICSTPDIEAFWYLKPDTRKNALNYVNEYAKQCGKKVPAVMLHPGIQPYVELDYE